MILRLVLLLALIAVAWVAVGVAERWRGRRNLLVPPGLTLVTSSGCSECLNAERRFSDLGIPYTTLDVAEAGDLGVASLTVPYAVVGSGSGELRMVRRGASVAADAEIVGLELDRASTSTA